MLPDNGQLSTTAFVSAFVDPVKTPGDFLIDYERGGIALNDPSQGLLVQLWTLKVERDPVVITQWNFYVESPANGRQFLFAAANVKEASLSFDQNMRPFVVYLENTTTKMWWYDPTIPGQTITTLGTDLRTPRCTMDERREWHTAISDIVLGYVRAGNLCVRYQRERYQTEHVLKPVGPTAELVCVGINAGGRLQFRCRKVTALDSQFAVNVDPFLADIVLALCVRAGINPEAVDVRELYDANVIGYKLNTDDGVNKRIDALREMFFFDKAEADKKLAFTRRGRPVVVRIPYRDLVADDPSALEQTRLQEKELARSVSVNHLDPAGGFATNKQTARRRSNIIKAKKDQTVESEVVLTADQAMTAASIKLKIAWHELQTFKFATTLKYAQVVSTDVVEVEDKRGNWYRVRITERNDNHPIIKFEGVQDAGQDVYATLGVGQSLPPPTSTTPGLVGETTLEILNIPTLRDQDDELGVYIAVAGASSAWYGSQILISTDGGVNFYEAMQIETPATLGETLTDIKDEISAEYPANQSFEVLVNFALESVTYENLLNNVNRCVVGDELMQFQFAVLLGMVDGHYRYRLSGLVRGRYATSVEDWPTGTRFVLLDSSIAFLQAQQWMLGQEIQIKPVSLGLTEDETVATGYDYLEGVSQREFPVHSVTAVRDGSNNVTVTFVGRGRLGIETAPRNGKYFAGYRIKFSNGNVIDTQNMTAVYNSAPAGITVQVCALNTVTGEGPYSTAIST